MKKSNKNTTTAKPTKKLITSKRIINSFCILFLSGMLIVTSVAFVLLENVLDQKKLLDGVSGLTASNSTVIYDVNGGIIETLSNDSGVRENITYEQLPQSVIDAFLSIEDSRFFKHNGFDLPRFVKAGFSNVTQGGLQGGSTLTMQLIDVASNKDGQKQQDSMADKLEQKIKEIFESMEVEGELSKEDVFIRYVNLINFGGSARGIQKGAQLYFGKNIEDVNLSEAAFLAGVINAPATNNPYLGVTLAGDGETYIKHYDNAMKRRNQTLDQMLNHGYITKDEWSLARSTQLAFQLNGEVNFSTQKNQAVIDAVREEALELTGNDLTIPSKIYTSIDPDAQAYAEKIQDESWYPNERYQSAFTLLNNQTGEIMALASGRNYGNDATDTIRHNRAYEKGYTQQIGSTAKPLVDYLPAFDDVGFSTAHTFNDKAVKYGEDVMKNADRTYHGIVDFHTALNNSYNVPALLTYREVINKIGAEKELELLHNMGFTSLKLENIVESICIGGGEMRANTTSLAGGYSVLANQGNYIKPHVIKSIDYQDDSIEDYTASQEKQRVSSAGAAYLMSYMLQGAVKSNFGNIASINASYPVYGKTGTSSFEAADGAEYNYPPGVARDKWIVGYTNKYTVATWAGYDKPVKGENNYLTPDELYTYNVEGPLTRKMLDFATNYGADAAEIPRTDDVSDITHVKGIFPYVKAAGDGAEMVSGMILKKFAGDLTTLSPDPLDAPSAVDANLPDASKIVAFSMTTYTPKKAEDEDTSAFDPVTTFGNVQYVFTIEVNGAAVHTVTTGENSGTYEIPELKNGDKVVVKGSYKYEKVDVSSASVASATLTAANLEPESETFTIDADFADTYATTNTFNLTRAKVISYMNSRYPKVKFVIQSSTAVSAGKLDPASQIYVGAQVNDKDTYTIYIGQ